MENEMIKAEQRGKNTIVTLQINNVIQDDNEDMVKAFDQLLDKGQTRIVLDLTPTKYVSSLILASWVYVQKRAQAAGGDLVMCGVNGRVKEIMEMTNLHKVFKIAEGIDDALKQLG